MMMIRITTTMLADNDNDDEDDNVIIFIKTFLFNVMLCYQNVFV